jgi:hypothetical protein
MQILAGNEMSERVEFLREILDRAKNDLWWYDQKDARAYLKNVGWEHLTESFERAIVFDSLDAARHIHKELTPKRFWEIHENVAYTHTKETEYDTNGVANGRPATAWVVAILEGYIEDEESKA